MSSTDCATDCSGKSSSDVKRLTGLVKWFNNKSGFGFITVLSEGEHASKDIFAHYSSIRVTNSQYKYLVQGEYVDFVLVKSENENHEYHATDITGVMGGAIMCETRRVAMASQSDRRVRNYRTSEEDDERRPPRTPRAPRAKPSADAAPAAAPTPRSKAATVDADGFVQPKKRGPPKSAKTAAK